MSRKSPEADLQRLVIQHLRLRHKPGVLFLSIPNESKRSAVMGGHLKAMGMLPGAADLLIVVNGMAHFIELKSERGKQTKAQEEFECDCIGGDVPYEVCNSIGEALYALQSWKAIKPCQL